MALHDMTHSIWHHSLPMAQIKIYISYLGSETSSLTGFVFLAYIWPELKKHECYFNPNCPPLWKIQKIEGSAVTVSPTLLFISLKNSENLRQHCDCQQ